MSYQSITPADGTPLLREKCTVEVVDEGVSGIDELNGSSTSRRSRKGAALGLLVLALGTLSALSAFGGRSSDQSECVLSLCVLGGFFRRSTGPITL